MVLGTGSGKREGFAAGRSASVVIVVVLSLCFTAFLQPPAIDASASATAMSNMDVEGRLHSLGGYFTENKGQVADGIRYYSRGNPSVGFRDDGVMFVISEIQSSRDIVNTGSAELIRSPIAVIEDGQVTRSLEYFLRFEGANSVRPTGNDRLPFDSNFFIGNDSGNWRTDVPNYRKVVYQDLYEGIDLVYSLRQAGLKYEFVIQPGADERDIRIRYEGIESLVLHGDGIVVQTALGQMHDSAPFSFQGEAEEVRCAFIVTAPLTQGFSCEGRDTSKTLTIDPLVYSTFIGGTDRDGVGWKSMAVDSDGNAYVSGDTLSLDFPVTPGAYNTTSNPSGHTDIFVTKLDSTGSALVYSTYLGGNHDDYGCSIAVDLAGNAYVTGWTRSSDFPTTIDAYDPSLGYKDAYVTKLNPAGNALVYSTYLGGKHSDEAWSIALDMSGNAYVTGGTAMGDFPTTPGSFDTTFNGGMNDAFVAKLNTTGSDLMYSAYLGGFGPEQGSAIAVDALGSAYVAGVTVSPDFPVYPGTFDESINGGLDGFVAKVDPSGGSLVYSTFLGGFTTDDVLSIAVDTLGYAYLTGYTESCCAARAFPVTPGAFNVTGDRAGNAFVTKLSIDGSTLVYSTFLGGDGWDAGNHIAVDSAGSAYVSGTTYSNDLPVTPDAVDGSCNCTIYSSDVFLMELNHNGTALLYSSFLGGAQWREDALGSSLALDSADNVYVTGYTFSSDFPVTPGAFDTTFQGSVSSPDVFVAKIAIGEGTNKPPVISSFTASTTNEGEIVAFTVDANDADGDALTYSFDFDSDGVFDASGLNSTASHVWGDDYIRTATVRVSDGKQFTEATTTVVVRNLPPSIRAEIATANVTGDLTLRVAGEKWHDVAMTLYKDRVAIANASVTRFPGSPDDQAATIEDVTIDLFDGDLSAIVTYTPEDDPVNGQLWGATPAWLVFTAKDGSESSLHHTFNVRHEDTWTWMVDDLRVLLAGVNLSFTATATDPGSDDLTFIWDWGDGTTATATTYYNDGIGPDPYPSPDGTLPFTATDAQVHAFITVTHSITLQVLDDDGGSSTLTLSLLVRPVGSALADSDIGDIHLLIQEEAHTPGSEPPQARDRPPFDPSPPSGG